MSLSRAIAATCLCRASSLAYDARFRSKVDGLVSRRRGDLLVVLEDCTDPANAASIARVCDGFGVPELLFVTSRRPEPAFDPCGRALRRNQLQRATRHRRDGFDGVGLTGLFSHSIPATLDKAREARKMIDESGYDIRLEIDGGVRSRRPAVLCAFTPSTRLVSIRRGREWFLLRFRGRSDRVERPRCSAQVSGANIKEVAEAGVDMFVAGSAIFRDPRTEEAYKKTIDAMRDELAAAKVPANKVAA